MRARNKAGAWGTALLLALLAGLHANARAAGSSAPASAEIEFLRKAVAGTPYSALVVHTRVDIKPASGKAATKGQPEEGGEERHTYHARVLETFRGRSHASIQYDTVVESGETVEFDSKPQIVTLCKGPRGFYWPGVGASFPGNADAIAEARRVGKQAVSGRPASSSQCD